MFKDFFKKLPFLATLIPTCLFASEVERPPQFVILAFDNCQTNEFWEESLKFSSEQKASGLNIPFTYFVSGVTLIPHAHRTQYQPDGLVAGKTMIEYAKDEREVQQKFSYIDEAFLAGHEIASHAIGHFNGADLNWSKNAWDSEFTQFTKFLFSNPWAKTIVQKNSVIGFRAPYLGNNKGMFEALLEHGFSYDTSETAQPNYWPKKVNGIWNYPLAELRIDGSNKKTLSMDYNFFVNQAKVRSSPKDDPKLRGETDAAYKERMFQTHGMQTYRTYMNYFNSNYKGASGNRAPIHIGHHFTQYMGGAYWGAMKLFAKTVCGLEEVKCVTYAELTKYLEAQDGATLEAYQKGNFRK